MLKLKYYEDYATLILFFLGLLFSCYMPKAYAQYSNSQILSTQNTSSLGQYNNYEPIYINSWTQTNADVYYISPIWGNTFLPGFIPTIPFDANGFLKINQGILSQWAFSKYNYNNSSHIETWGQYNIDSYYSWILWSDPVLQELKTTIPLKGYEFSEINKNILSKDLFSNSSWFNNYEYPNFSIPINRMINSPANFDWSHIGFLFPQRIPVNHLSKGYAYFQNGDYEYAIKELEKAITLSYTEVAKAEGYLLLGMSYQALGIDYVEEAEKYLELAAGLQVDNIKVGLQLAKVYYQQGKYSKAIEEYKHIIEKEPENGEAIKGLALSYFKTNELTIALKMLEKTEMNDPNDLEIIYTMGVIYEVKHLYLEAIDYFNKVTDFAPDSSWASQARDHLNGIEMIGGASNIEEIEEEIKMLILTAPEPEDRPDDALIVLLDDIHYNLFPDDTLITRTHKLVKILNERGKEGAEIKFSYDASYQYITIDLARVIKPDGTITGVSAEDIQEVAPWGNFPLYGNFKVLILSMPGITVGSVFEYQVTLEDIPDSKLFEPREIDAGFSLASTNPIKRARIKVSVPSDREFNIVIKNREPLEPEIVLDGEMKHFIWRLNDIPKMIVQPMMLPFPDIIPILFITSFPSWEIIADWWREFEFQSITPDEAIRAKVKQLTYGLYTLKEKARAIFNYVASQIRYVGIEYGKSGVIPHHASETYENKYGDCKNKAILLISMFREAGIHTVYPVLISTVSSGRAWEEVPRVYTFNHAIALCIIDDEWIWMDPTVETSAFGEFPSGDQDREVLVIFDDGYDLIRTPVVASAKNTDREIINVQVAVNSSATFSSMITTTGINAIYSRAYFKDLDPIYRKQHLETIVAGRTTGGGKLIDFTLSDVENLNEPYKLEFQYTDPHYIEWAGDIGFIKVSYLTPNKAAISEEERIHSVFLGNTSVGESVININLPENIEIRYLPPPITLEIPQILFKSEYTLKDHTITYYLLYEIRQLYIPLEEYPEYKNFQEQVDMELKRKIIVELK